MAIIICEQCKAEIEIPAGYNVPFIKCTVCGAPQRVMKAPSGGPKFKILDNQRRSNATNNTLNPIPSEPVSAKTTEQQSNASPVAKPVIKQQATLNISREQNSSFKPIEEEKMILDSVGDEGLKKALELVADYICLSNPKAKAAGRAKAIQQMMKAKYPASIATKAIAYTERLPEAMTLGKSKNIKKVIIIAGTAAVLIAGVLSFL